MTKLQEVETRNFKWWKLWILFFLYTASLALLVQVVILPYFLPKAHLGHGLFVFDAGGFHSIAARKALEIGNAGWSAWELRPGGQYPAGIASIFYYLFQPEPYSVIPFNAAAHATSGVLVFFLLLSFLSSRTAALSGATLFVVNPACLEWTAQIHKDGTFILGNLLVITAWILLAKAVDRGKLLGFLTPPLLTLIGALLIWMSRPYWNQVSITASVTIILVIAVYWIPKFIKKHKIPYHILAILTGCIMIALQTPLVDPSFSLIRQAEYIQSQQKEVLIADLLEQKEKIFDEQKEKIFDEEKEKIFDEEKLRELDERISAIERIPIGDKWRPEGQIIKWVHNPFLPKLIDSRLYSLSFFRGVTGSQGGQTLLDREFVFNSVSDFIRYLPRAMQIGFLSPFPNVWFGKGSIPANTIGRRILGLMTAFSYLCFLSLIVAISRYYQNLNFCMIVIFGLLGTLVFTYGYPNVGSLNRMRYGFYMLTAVAGFSFAIQETLPRLSSTIRSISKIIAPSARSAV